MLSTPQNAAPVAGANLVDRRIRKAALPVARNVRRMRRSIYPPELRRARERHAGRFGRDPLGPLRCYSGTRLQSPLSALATQHWAGRPLGNSAMFVIEFVYRSEAQITPRYILRANGGRRRIAELFRPLPSAAVRYLKRVAVASEQPSTGGRAVPSGLKNSTVPLEVYLLPFPASTTLCLTML